MGEQRTDRGRFIEDGSGLWHYQFIGSLGTHFRDGAADALRNNPGNAWFWWSGVPVPILSGDTVETLRRRWGRWHDTFQKKPGLEVLDFISRELHPEILDRG